MVVVVTVCLISFDEFLSLSRFFLLSRCPSCVIMMMKEGRETENGRSD